MKKKLLSVVLAFACVAAMSCNIFAADVSSGEDEGLEIGVNEAEISTAELGCNPVKPNPVKPDPKPDPVKPDPGKPGGGGGCGGGGSTEPTTETTTESKPSQDPDDVYSVLGAKVMWYDVNNGNYELGRIGFIGHTPKGSDLHYTVLDNTSYWTTDEELSTKDWNEAVKKINIIYSVSQKYLDAKVSGEEATTDPSIFGRIDSNGSNSSLTVTPYAVSEIQDRAGNNMYVCIADGNGSITHVLMIIDESIQYDDDFDGDITPFVYSFSSNGFKSYKDLVG